MHSRILNDIHIEQDLGIPLSYDAAWKISSRWSKEVRGQRGRLGEKMRQTVAPPGSCCYCSRQSCSTRCPFFGLCKLDTVNTEEKVRGVMKHTQNEEPQLKGVLRSLNEWYNTRCTTVSGRPLDLTKFSQIKIKYKIPPQEIGKINNNEKTPRHHVNAKSNVRRTSNKPMVNNKKKTKEKLPNEHDPNELYYSIEKELRNLSVSQSRLKHMSVSLCRLAYDKKNMPKAKAKPQVYKYSVEKPSSNSTSDDTRNASSKSTSFNKTITSKFSKKSKSSETTKQSNSSKSNKTSKSSGVSKSSKADGKISPKTKYSAPSESAPCGIKVPKSLGFADTRRISNIKKASHEQQSDSKRNAKSSRAKDKVEGTISQALNRRHNRVADDAYNRSNSNQSTGRYRTVRLKPAAATPVKQAAQSKPAVNVGSNRSQKCKPQTAGGGGLSVKRRTLSTGAMASRGGSGGNGSAKRVKKTPSVCIFKPTVALLPKNCAKSKSNMGLKRKKSICAPVREYLKWRK
ncbi:uncharacterized protein LOC129248654 [Anastrepha obliqua]|uniref:uncharacterized protein LOC129248654 n=1 Tax=Anastrepha obliqua TaxID=95512 RepID=UPI002409CFCF|nr:uncharacterized protein LOC129248654 [Anastrepha obliqua]